MFCPEMWRTSVAPASLHDACLLLREKAKAMEREAEGAKAGRKPRRREGVILLRALLATFRSTLVRGGLILMADSMFHILQARATVGVRPWKT